MITVYYNGKPYQYADSTKYLELARTLQPQFEHDIVLASVNGFRNCGNILRTEQV